MKNKTVLVLGMGLAGVAVLWYAKNKAEAAVQALNPMNPDNIIHGGASSLAEEITGNEHALQDGADHVFAALDWLNPWAPDHRKVYAKTVLFGDGQ